MNRVVWDGDVLIRDSLFALRCHYRNSERLQRASTVGVA